MNKFKGRKILIVDDDLFLLDMYAMKFRDEGFVVEVAHGATEALVKLENHEIEPEVILSDVLMPGMDGFEFLRKLREKSLLYKFKIMILSNLGQKEEIEMGMDLGAKDYIVKAHHTPTEVVEKVKKLL